MAVSFRIDGAEKLAARLGGMADAAFPAVSDALAKCAEHVLAAKWRAFAGGGVLPGVAYRIRHPRGEYAASIATRRVSPLEFEVYSGIRQAAFFEGGTKAADFKRTHPYGPKSRVSKDGVPYLIVPFRWGTSKDDAPGLRNIMPESVYKIVKSFESSSVVADMTTTDRISKNASGADVPRAKYVWKSRLGKGFEGTTDTGKTVSLAGLSRFDAGKDGRYWAFRVVSARSPARSWLKPAFPALHVSERVAEAGEADVAAAVEAAAVSDFA